MGFAAEHPPPLGQAVQGPQVPFSVHCALAVSAHACCAMERLAHLEYFHDHVRLEKLLFDGTLDPGGSALRPNRSPPGLGLEMKRADATEYQLYGGP